MRFGHARHKEHLAKIKIVPDPFCECDVTPAYRMQKYRGQKTDKQCAI